MSDENIINNNLNDEAKNKEKRKNQISIGAFVAILIAIFFAFGIL